MSVQAESNKNKSVTEIVQAAHKKKMVKYNELKSNLHSRLNAGNGSVQTKIIPLVFDVTGWMAGSTYEYLVSIVSMNKAEQAQDVGAEDEESWFLKHNLFTIIDREIAIANSLCMY